MKIHTKQEVEKVAPATGFIKDSVEEVLRLIDLLKAIDNLSEFVGKLALKGGMAINLCIVDCPRLSMNIDSGYAENLLKEEMAAVRAQLKSNLIDYLPDNDYTLSEKPRGHTILPCD